MTQNSTKFTPAQEKTMTVTRTARYFTLGSLSEATRQVWIACHGYGQLAAFFIKHFHVLDDGSRFIVAPEALSRFYLDTTYERIGASWMTRENRQHEVEDYVNYLTSLTSHIFMHIPREQVELYVLGFSQGVATVFRWLFREEVKADHLIMWAGAIPPEIDLKTQNDFLRNTRLSVVWGTQDELSDWLKVEDQQTRLREANIPFRTLPFEGSHRMDSGILLHLGAPLNPVEG